MNNQNEVVWRIKEQSFVYAKKQLQVRLRGQDQVFIYRLWEDFFLSEQSVSDDFVRGEQIESVCEDFELT